VSKLDGFPFVSMKSVCFMLCGFFRGQLRRPKEDQMVPGTNYGMFNDLGVYGVPAAVKRKEKYDAVKALRSMEKLVQSSRYEYYEYDKYLRLNTGSDFRLQIYAGRWGVPVFVC